MPFGQVMQGSRPRPIRQLPLQYDDQGGLQNVQNLPEPQQQNVEATKKSIRLLIAETKHNLKVKAEQVEQQRQEGT